jgi:hypothetical protein
MADIITVSRSAIQTRLKCRRERQLGYDYEGTGIVRNGSKFDAMIGNCAHTGLADMLRRAKTGLGGYVTSRSMAVKELTQWFTANGFDIEGEDRHAFQEQRWLLLILLYGWEKFRLPAIIREYTIEQVEREQLVEFKPSDYLPNGLAEVVKPVQLPLRLDALLRRKSDQLLFILDFKTVSSPTDDWNVMLDNSLQSHLYVEAAKLIVNEPIGGIMYEGLVKGKRQMDNAISSPFRGQTIQYGSFLYGWEKAGTLYKDYVKGRQRAFIPAHQSNEKVEHMVEAVLPGLGFDMSSYFPNTLPWMPLDSHFVIGQVIVNENEYANNLETVNSYPEGSPLRAYYNEVLFEQNLDGCFKYGAKHPCMFVDICHNKIHPDEIKQLYSPREDHHAYPNSIKLEGVW